MDIIEDEMRIYYTVDEELWWCWLGLTGLWVRVDE